MIVLGCMLTSVNHLNLAANLLQEDDFYFLEHRIIFRVLQDAFKSDRPMDPHLTGEELKRRDQLNIIGGPSYLITLSEFAGTSAYIEEYAEIIRSKSILRKMIQAAKDIEKKAAEEPRDVTTALDDAQNLLFRISQTTNLAPMSLLQTNSKELLLLKTNPSYSLYKNAKKLSKQVLMTQALLCSQASPLIS